MDNMYNKIPSFNYMRTSIICGVVFIFGILFGYALFPWLLKSLMASQINLKPGTELREMWTKVPFGLDFKIYLFNITNKDEVSKGAKPRLQEVGPYMFEEWKEKFDLEDQEEDDTVTFNMKNTFIFRPDLSNGLTGNEVITTVHALIMNMALAVNVDKKPMLPMVAKAIDGIFHTPTDAFWTGRVMDLLFDGIDVDCSSTVFEAQATCSMFDSDEIKAIRKVGDNQFKFSLFGGNNGTGFGIYKVYRGIKNNRDIGRVITFNDEPEMDVWDGDECNQYRGTDSTIFPPGLKASEGLWAYDPNICRSIGAVYVGKSSYMGIPTKEFTLDLGDVKKDPSLECYCLSFPDDCPRPGTFNLFQCVGSPIIASMPHFYNADPSLLQGIESGLNPNKDEHAVYIHFESISGTPVSARKRLQFNLEIKPLAEIESMKDLPEVVMPMFWVEEGAALNKTYVDVLKKSLFLVIKIASAIKWICIIIGSIGCGIAAFLHFKKQNILVVTTPEKPVSAVSIASDDSMDKGRSPHSITNGIKMPDKY